MSQNFKQVLNKCLKKRLNNDYHTFSIIKEDNFKNIAESAKKSVKLYN